VDDFNLTFVPAHHTSRRGLLKSSKNSSLWGGWVIEKSGFKIWFAGDIAFGDGSYYEEIGKRFSPIDVSFLPIGSYKPSRYTRQHISPRQAVQLHLMVGSKKSIAMHWGTFGMVYERLEDPPADLNRARLELKVPVSDFFTLFHGEICPLFE
jgi:L-ascorbate metabolism protein UlaG (beta-lactamase superfamily)